MGGIRARTKTQDSRPDPKDTENGPLPVPCARLSSAVTVPAPCEPMRSNNKPEHSCGKGDRRSRVKSVNRYYANNFAVDAKAKCLRGGQNVILSGLIRETRCASLPRLFTFGQYSCGLRVHLRSRLQSSAAARVASVPNLEGVPRLTHNDYQGPKIEERIKRLGSEIQRMKNIRVPFRPGSLLSEAKECFY